MSKLFVVAALAATCASAVPAFAATDSECQAMWTKADANNDGVLSGPESMRYAAAMRVHNAKISEKDKITKADFMTDTPIVELRGITKSFPGVLANDHVDLTLQRGEIHCLLGENGAGKSTLIGILSGLQRPDAGSILIEGRETEITSPRVALELGIGTVYQHSALIPALTVLENLMLGDSRSAPRSIVPASRPWRRIEM